MNVVSVCSGAGGLDLGLERAGMTVVQFCEIDPHARSVLARHWPDVPCHDDITTLDGSTLRGRVDLVAGGTPCTDLSVAGRRDGLGGDESRLFWDFCRVADQSAARWVLWENVAGAFSSHDGADFAAVLWGLTGYEPAVPEDGWRSVGVCVGPRRAAVWRLLDAQWFGVAQRRRRVFVVACPPADIDRAIEVLLDAESVPRSPRPSRTPGESVAALTSAGVGTCGADDNQGQAGHLIPEPTTFAYKVQGDEGTTIVGPAGLSHTLGSNPIAVAVSENQRGELLLTDYAHQITAGGGKPGQGYPAVLTPDLAVRRLTPLECERLMGWPDDHTRYDGEGTEIADSHRYRMCGNGVVSQQSEWIGRRLMAVAA